MENKSKENESIMKEEAKEEESIMKEEAKENESIMKEEAKEEVEIKGPQTPSGPPPDESFEIHSPEGPPPDLEDEEVEKKPEEVALEVKNKNNAETKKKHISVYSRAVIHKKIPIEMVQIGKNIKQYIEKYVARSYEGKCIVEGYIKPGSTQIISYSSGIVRANCILFEVVFECLACYPVEGMLIQAIAKNITKAGIRAESADEKPSPLIIFVARDHHYSNAAFSKIKEGDKFLARVIGQRFELNDSFVSVIAEWIDPNRRSVVRKK